MKRLLFGLSIFGVFFVGVANGCVCSGLGVELSSYYKGSDAFILGKVVSHTREKYEIDVASTWKGDVEEKVVIVDVFSGSSCGSNYKVGESFYFFLASTNQVSMMDEWDKYSKVTTPIRIDGKQVFFSKPCVPVTTMSKWKKFVREYDKSGFWKGTGKSAKSPKPILVAYD